MKKIVVSFVLLFVYQLLTVQSVIAATAPVVGFFSPPRTWSAVGNANLPLRYPDPRNGDLLVAVIAVRPSTSTVNTPTGWNVLGSYTGTDGRNEGADRGSVRLYWFYRISDGTEGTSTINFTQNGGTSVWIGSIMQVRSASRTYDLSLGGYSINGDTTNWGGTLDTNIGLTSGDLVLLAAAQQGDAASSSSWDITATGITSKSTVVEHGEFGSTVGNDIDVGLASTLIWGGTNSTTPTVSMTQSTAVSGAVTALRIRQGSGENRNDTWVRAAGSQVAGTTSLAVPYPEHDVGDVLVMYVGNRNDTSSPTDPPGWTSLGSYSGGSGAFGVDSGNSRITAYWREVSSRLSGTQSVTISGANTSVGQILSLHRETVEDWQIDSDGGADSTPGTSWSVSGTGIDLNSARGGDVLLVGSSVNTDARQFSGHTLSAAGITFGDITQAAEYRSLTGNQMTLEITNGRVSGGSATNIVPSFTSTADGSGTNDPTGASLFVKVLGVSPAIPMPASNAYELHDYGFGSGGMSVADSSSYSMTGLSGEVSGAQGSSSLYNLGPGITYTRQASTPAAPVLSNPSNYYNRLRVVITPVSSPSDTQYIIALSSDNFATQEYVQADGSLQSTPFAQSYASWGGASGQIIVGLLPSTTYKARVAAIHTKYNQSSWSQDASAATIALTLSYDIDVSATDAESAPPYNLPLGSLVPGSITTATNKIWIDLETNSSGGGFVYVYNSANGLQSTAASHTITSTTGNLASVQEGYGAQVDNTTQTSGGPFVAESPYNSAGDTVGILDTSTRTIFSSSSVPVTGGRGSIVIKAKASAQTPSGGDYTSILTMIASGSF